MNIKTALSQWISGTWDRAKKYRGDRKKENGIRRSLIVLRESIKRFWNFGLGNFEIDYKLKIPPYRDTAILL
jgi:hypothetical protein